MMKKAVFSFLLKPFQGLELTLLKRIVLTYVLPYKGLILRAVIFMAIASAMTALFASLLQPVLDKILVAKQEEAVLPLALAVLACFVIRGLATYAHTILMTKAAQSVVADIQARLFDHFMSLDLQFFQDNPSGQLISRIVNDVAVMRHAVVESLTGIGKNLITVVFLVGVMIWKDPGLSFFALVIFPFAAGFVAWLGKRIRKISKNIQNGIADMTSLLGQVFQGIRQVKAYGMEPHEERRIHNAIHNVRRMTIKAVRVGSLSVPVNETLVGFTVFGIIAYGGHQVATGDMTAGQLVSFIGAFSLAYEPMKRLGKLHNTMQTGLGAAERVFEMMDKTAAIENDTGAVDLNISKAHVCFKDITFRYTPNEAPAVQNISFEMEPGTVTALVGPSGSGKTTLMNLLPRFYDAEDGVIDINGTPIRSINIESLRHNIALVSQHITIFDDTIEANIAYGDPDASPEQIRLAAQAAAADEFIRTFPGGYETRVGENGLRLSGGQRQRIAIARAILRNAPILLLDEATSALDNESEYLIQESLTRLQEGRTTLVIAHRLSTVLNADKIIVLNEGRIVEQGKHQDLIRENGLYAKMYERGLQTES